MPEVITLHIDRPITSVTLLSVSHETAGGISSEHIEGTYSQDGKRGSSVRGLESQEAEVARVYQMLEGLIEKVNRFYDKMFAGHTEQIAKLSVEIARKVLMQKVDEKDYQIEKIVEEALKNAPTRRDIVVHLNPEDLEGWQKFQQSAGRSLNGIEFVADSDVAAAECLLESPKGIIESSIEKYLEQVFEALKKVK